MKNLVLSQCLGEVDILIFFCQVLLFLDFLGLLLLLKLFIKEAKDCWFFVAMALLVICALLLTILVSALASVNLMIVEIIATIVGLLIMILKKNR